MESMTPIHDLKEMARRRFGSSTAMRCGVIAGENSLSVDLTGQSDAWRQRFQEAFDWASQRAAAAHQPTAAQCGQKEQL